MMWKRDPAVTSKSRSAWCTRRSRQSADAAWKYHVLKVDHEIERRGREHDLQPERQSDRVERAPAASHSAIGTKMPKKKPSLTAVSVGPLSSDLGGLRQAILA